MSDAPKCEPPGDLAKVDGWHWVQVHNWAPRLAEWQVAPYGGRQPLWKDYERQRSCTPDWAAREWGYRYVGPALTPAEAATLRAERDAAVAAVARLREALEGLMGFLPWNAMDKLETENGVIVGWSKTSTFSHLLEFARAALNPEPAP